MDLGGGTSEKVKIQVIMLLFKFVFSIGASVPRPLKTDKLCEVVGSGEST